MIEFLTERQKKIIDYVLRENKYVSVKNIAETLEVSKKTVYRELKAVKENIGKEITIEKIRGKGVKIIFSGKSKISLANKKEIFENLSAKSRRMEILTMLLKNSPKTTSIEKLSEKYYVGKTSIVNDLNFIKNRIKSYDLKLEGTKYGTRITGQEMNIRNMLAHMINTSARIDKANDIQLNSDRIDKITLKELSRQFDIQKIIQIEKKLKETEKKLKYIIADYYYINIITYLLILTERLIQGNTLYRQEETLKGNMDKSDIIDMEIYKISLELSKEIEKLYKIEIPNNELYFIYKYLVSSGIGEIKQNDDFRKLIGETDPKVKIIVNEIIEKFFVMTGTELKENVNLYESLILHVRAMLNRIEYKIKIFNPLLDDIKNEFSKIYNIINLIMINIENKYDIGNIDENEIGYLAVYFQAALETGKMNGNVLIVCSNGIGTSQLLRGRIGMVFPELKIKEVVSVNNLEKGYNLKNIDFIISTVQLNNEEKPVIYVNSILTDKDIETIKNEIMNNSAENKLTRKKIPKNVSDTKLKYHKMKDICSEDLILPDLEKKTKNEVFEEVSVLLYKKNIIKSADIFLKEINEREMQGTTNLKNGIAIPHIRSENILRNKIVIARNTVGIKWRNDENEKVKIIFFVFTEKSNQKEKNEELEAISKIIENLIEEEFQKILLKGNKKEILEGLGIKHN